MYIIHISAECYPAAKVGGLADVVGALPKYQAQLGHKTKVVIPFYHNKFREGNHFEKTFTGKAKVGHKEYWFNVLEPVNIDLGYKLCMIDIPGLFDRPDVYSHDDDTERFIAFQVAIVNWLNMEETIPDVVHCHDGQSGFIPFFMHKVMDYNRLQNIKTIYTIHNGEYQGQFGFDKINLLPPFHSYFTGMIEWNNDINPVACAIKSVNKVTTVSPGYMEEVQYNMSGLEKLLQIEQGKCTGILNGIDTEFWNPETDELLKANYQVNKAVSGKKANKKWLCKEFDLDNEKPLFIFIGRLVHEKGADFLSHAIYHSFEKYGKEFNVLVLGSGNHEIEQAMFGLEHVLKGNYCSYIGYNEQLAHIMYAGADFLLMPSRVEPCGLNQLYALRYGTIPIVRRIGGLRDTVIDIGDGGFGICHDQATADDVIHSIGRALKLHQDQKTFRKNQKVIMKIDHSWTRSASEYLDLYTK